MLLMAVPAVADESLTHHSIYQQHKVSCTPTGSCKFPLNNITIDWSRAQGQARITGSNKCLGSYKFPNGKRFAWYYSFQTPVSRARIAFHGTAQVTMEYLHSSHQSNMKVSLSATLRRYKAVGSLRFPGTKCGTISFTAPIAKYYK